MTRFKNKARHFLYAQLADYSRIQNSKRSSRYNYNAPQGRLGALKRYNCHKKQNTQSYTRVFCPLKFFKKTGDYVPCANRNCRKKKDYCKQVFHTFPSLCLYNLFYLFAIFFLIFRAFFVSICGSFVEFGREGGFVPCAVAFFICRNCAKCFTVP